MKCGKMFIADCSGRDRMSDNDKKFTEMFVSDHIIDIERRCFSVRGLSISAAFRYPHCRPKAFVHLIHGMGEHKERYFPFMEYLAENGYVCVITDIRGHGQSVVKGGDLGDLYANAESLIPDEQRFFYKWTPRWISSSSVGEYVKGHEQEFPRFIIGHSLGSLITRILLDNPTVSPDGVILLGTPCYSPISAALDTTGADVLIKKFGGSHRSEAINDITEAYLNRSFGDIPHSWISSDPEAVKKFNDDPLCGFTYTVSGYMSILKIMNRAYHPHYEAKNPLMPIHLMSGRDDPLLFSEEKFTESTDILRDKGYCSVTSHIYDGMRHELLNEKDRMTVWNDILQRLDTWTDAVHRL